VIDEPALNDSEAVRTDVRAWLTANWSPGEGGPSWRERVLDARWAAPGWPHEWYGRGYPSALSRVVRQEFARAGAPGSGHDVLNLWANVLLAVGSDDQKTRFVRRLVLEETHMCLLYSEPGAGSDLAAVATTAEEDGEHWIVNGQKVWSSGAHAADYGFLVARTDWGVPKHHGITFFLFPMRQAGVEVRPIKQITGAADFNEVFFTDARVPDDLRIGEINAGWAVLQVALACERMVMGGAVADVGPSSGAARPRSRAPGLVPAVDLIAIARETGRFRDPIIRQALAAIHGDRAVNDWNTRRAIASATSGESSPLASLGKLAMSHIEHETGHVRAALNGSEAMLDSPSSTRGAGTAFSLLNAYFTSIGGGTDQVQRNIIGERLLGLPREPAVDRDQPFRDVLRAPPPDRHTNR
jgi:alkylation response protein AidB-like acyl-CoA dehydrogenase